MKKFNSRLQKIIEQINSLRIDLINEEDENCSFEEGILANAEYSLTKLLNKWAIGWGIEHYNNSDIKNETGKLVTGNYGVRYINYGTDYNMYGNVNGVTSRALVTNITDESLNNGIFVYNDRFCA